MGQMVGLIANFKLVSCCCWLCFFFFGNLILNFVNGHRHSIKYLARERKKCLRIKWLIALRWFWWSSTSPTTNFQSSFFFFDSSNKPQNNSTGECNFSSECSLNMLYNCLFIKCGSRIERERKRLYLGRQACFTKW